MMSVKVYFEEYGSPKVLQQADETVRSRVLGR